MCKLHHPAHEQVKLFEVPFHSRMDDADVAALGRALDVATHLHPKLHDSPARAGVVRLNFDSGLFLERGPREDQWALEARTWGHPTARTVHAWHLLAAEAARHLEANSAHLTKEELVDDAIKRSPR